MLETSSVRSALHTAIVTEKALLSATVRRVTSGLRKILQLWLVHVSIPATRASCLLTTYAYCWFVSAVSKTFSPAENQSHLQDLSGVKACVKESLDELHGFYSAASSSLVIHWLSLRFHICIKLLFNRTNSPIIKKLFSCQWDRRGPHLGTI